MRSSRLPWGLFGLGAKHLRQLDKANVLLLVAITFFAAAAASGACALLEHPAFCDKHTDLDAPSIWRLDMLNCFLEAPACRRHLVMQGRLGAASWKPTMFQAFNLPYFLDMVAKYSVEPAPGQLVALVGRDSADGLETAASREYPGILCKTIAHAACLSICEAPGGHPVNAGLVDQLRQYYIPLDGYGTYGPGADHCIEDTQSRGMASYNLGRMSSQQ